MSKVIAETKEQILKLMPGCQDVNIKIKREPDGNFISQIHLRAKRKILHATKKDSNFRRSLDKSYHALVKQIQKLKMD